jgi:hypothetical protein
MVYNFDMPLNFGTQWVKLQQQVHCKCSAKSQFELQ